MHDLLGLTFQWATGGGDRFSTAIYPFEKLIWQLSNLERAIWQHGKLLWVKCKLLQFFGFSDKYANGLFQGLGWINSKNCVSQNLKIHRFWILLLTWRQRQRVRGRCEVRFTSWCHCIFSCERCHKAELAHSLDFSGLSSEALFGLSSDTGAPLSWPGGAVLSSSLAGSANTISRRYGHSDGM